MSEEAAPQEQSQETQQDVTASQEDPSPAPEAPAKLTPVEKRKYQIKVNGQDREVELDDEEIKVRLQKGYAADQKFEEVAKTRQEVMREKELMEKFFEDLDRDPRGTLKKHPRLAKMDWRTISEQELMEQLERDRMDPRDLKLREYEAKEKEREEKERADNEAREKKESEERLNKKATERKNVLAQTIGSILNKPESGLPAEPRVVSRIAHYMQHCIKNEIPFTQEAIIERVHQDYKQDFAQVFSKATAKQIFDIIGEAKFKDLLKWDIESKQGGNKPPAPPSAPRNRNKGFKTIEERNIERYGMAHPLIDDDY